VGIQRKRHSTVFENDEKCFLKVSIILKLKLIKESVVNRTKGERRTPSMNLIGETV
jgi:hypothetical protein